MYCTPVKLIELFGAGHVADISEPRPPHDANLVTEEGLYYVALTEVGTPEALQMLPPEPEPDELAACMSALLTIKAALSAASREADGYLIKQYGHRMKSPEFLVALEAETSLPEQVADVARERLASQSSRSQEIIEERAKAARRWLRDIADGRVELGIQTEAVRYHNHRRAARPGRSDIDWSRY
ncbi:hypothetical protein JCM19239_6026 [Vibrio variabilis]|uniref:Uncharacterized protein n=1 Tax=Vibrio variabilis TaxID=990271 RepID=A0ABQ0JLQ1_9VIBR|nr:hypothetical protein JCM19239_6026 [Vibrio variabilis]